MKKGYYFTTRDLLFMAGFSAIGGLAGTYINMIGDFFQSALGFAGTTQWAAGLHVLWILLAVGIVRKPGTAVLTGILKGVVELLSGNTHGILVLIVDVAAGLVIELVFLLPIMKGFLKSALAGGLAAMSNVFVFQLFASVPADSLAFWSMLAVAGMAFLSGVVFGGVLSQGVLKNLAKTGIINEQEQPEKGKLGRWIFLGVGILLCVVLSFVYVQKNKGVGEVIFSGNVPEGAVFNMQDTLVETISVETGMQGQSGTYTGYLLRDVLEEVGAGQDSDMVLVVASDGYSYFIPSEEIKSNPNLIIVVQGEGEDTKYNVVGAENSKAWVRGLREMIVFQSTPVPILKDGEQVALFRPQEWQFDMDSVRFELEAGSKKLQGVAVHKVLSANENTKDYALVSFFSTNETYTIERPLLEQDENIRIFVNIEGYQMSYLLGTLQGEVYIENITEMSVE